MWQLAPSALAFSAIFSGPSWGCVWTLFADMPKAARPCGSYCFTCTRRGQSNTAMHEAGSARQRAAVVEAWSTAHHVDQRLLQPDHEGQWLQTIAIRTAFAPALSSSVTVFPDSGSGSCSSSNTARKDSLFVTRSVTGQV